jgi:hypothetical protein
MKAKSLKVAVGVMLLFAFQLMATAAGAQTVLIDKTFDFDISAWNYFGGPEIIMIWDGDRGMPGPGSLRSARVSLSLFLSPPAGMTTCNFDSVTLTRDPQ